MLQDIVWWLLLGLLFAAMVSTWAPASFLAQWGDGFTAFLVMALIGIPMYICATASTPIAAGLLMAGLSPGAVLVFLMAGPATNLGTIGIVHKTLGGRSLVAYLSGVILTSFVFAYGLNYLNEALHLNIGSEADAEYSMANGFINYLSAAVLAGLIINVVWRQWRSKVAVENE